MYDMIYIYILCILCFLLVRISLTATRYKTFLDQDLSIYQQAAGYKG